MRITRFLLFIIILCTSSTAFANDNHQTFQDSVFWYTINYPSQWISFPSDGEEEGLRFNARSSDGSRTLSVYTISGYIDEKLKWFGKQIPDYLPDLGEEIQAKDEKRFLQRFYLNKGTGFYTQIIVKKNSTFGYLIVSTNKDGQFGDIQPYVNSFKSKVPFFTDIKNRIRADRWMYLIFIGFFICAIHKFFTPLTVPKKGFILLLIAPAIMWFFTRFLGFGLVVSIIATVFCFLVGIYFRVGKIIEDQEEKARIFESHLKLYKDSLKK